MRTFFAVVLGLTAAALGVLIHRPDEDNELRPLQIGLNELPWFPALLGGLAVLLGFRRSRLAVLLGLFGAGVSLWPYTQYRAAVEDMASAMRTGLGKDYEAHIPSAVQNRLLPSIEMLPGSLTQRANAARAHIWRDVAYASPDGSPLTLTVYEPMIEPAVGDLYPAVMVIQGGGWRSLDSVAWFESHNRYLASQGYVVFDIQHRLSQVAKWPAQLQDVQGALRWVKQHAADYRVDPQRVAILGRSSGAHLALMAGMRAQDSGVQVQSIVDIYAPTDLQLANLSPGSAILQLMGGRLEDRPAAYADASPIAFVRDDLPSILLIEGMMDNVVPYHHGDKLVNRLSLTNTPFVLLRLPWSRHGFDAVPFGMGGQLVQYHMDRFLAWSLYGENHA
jgi:acetyl esterase/lipase